MLAGDRYGFYLLIGCFCVSRETTEGLGRQIAKELKPGLAVAEGAADLSDEESAFTGVAGQCLSVLVLGINTRLDACLQVGGCYYVHCLAGLGGAVCLLNCFPEGLCLTARGS